MKTNIICGNNNGVTSVSATPTADFRVFESVSLTDISQAFNAWYLSISPKTRIKSLI